MVPKTLVTGALRSKVVARLSGASVGQLRGWHRSGALPASSHPGGRGRLRLYSWIDYSKARAAKKLLDQGLPVQRLKQNLMRLDAEIPEWYHLPLLAFQGHVIVPAAEGLGFTIIEKQAAMGEFVREAQLVRGGATVETEPLLGVVRELQQEGPLGQLSHYGQLVTIDPGTCWGSPILIGTRLETALIATMFAKGFQSGAEIASRYQLTLDQVDAAVEFEAALAA